MAKKRDAWAFWANANGPLWITPQKVRYSDSLDSWWHSNENADVSEMGLEIDGTYICFASHDKKEVRQFVAGFMAARHIVKQFTG